jgi:CMP-N-acetylneuraminic acid synthetase
MSRIRPATLGVVTARGGSKGIPRKNIRLLGGKPLLCYTAEAALAAKRLARVVLSTEDPEIAAIGEAAGLEVPFLRSAELAQDQTPTLPVLQDVVRRLEALGRHYDAVCLLQPTNPFRPVGLIDACVQRLYDNNADSVVTVLPVPAEHNPHWVYFEDEQGLLHLSTGDSDPISRRQDLPPAFHREGSVYVTRRRVLMEQNSLYGRRVAGFLMAPEHSVNIDSAEDWQRAEQLQGKLRPR